MIDYTRVSLSVAHSLRPSQLANSPRKQPQAVLAQGRTCQGNLLRPGGLITAIK